MGNLVSIIIPVYNIEEYLRQCLDSILAQTYPHFNVILVNDGSTDSSPSICKEYVEKDSRFKLVNKENGGLSSARNAGFNNANGDFICFIDGDDYIHPKTLEVQMKAFEEHPDCDIVMSRGKKIYTKYEQPSADLDNGGTLLGKDDLIKGLFVHNGATSNNQVQFIVVWNKLYRRQLLEGEPFNKTVSEDIDFNLRVYQKSNGLYFLNAMTYYWIERKTSLSTAKSFAIKSVGAYKDYYHYLPKDNEQYHAWFLYDVYRRIIDARYFSHNEPEEPLAEATFKEIDNIFKDEFKSNRLIPLKQKAFVNLFKNHPTLYRICYQLAVKAIGLISCIRKR